MNKVTRNILIVAIIVLLVFGIIFIIYNKFKSEPIDANSEQENILTDANEGLDNLINNIFDENQENVNNEEDASATDVEASNNNDAEKTDEEDKKNNNLENQTTPGEQKAIELVKEEWKKEWGDLDGVSFNNVMIQGDGKYVVSVNDSKTTKVIHRYVVDTGTGLVEEKE